MIIQRVGMLAVLMLFYMGAVASSNPGFQPDPKGAAQARLVVEQVLIRAYEQTLASGEYSEQSLANAPISGKTDRRGRHLLSFSAFNQFPELARWGLDHGADINLGDKDTATMLRMALGNYNLEMARFALENGAEPNMLMGEGKDTMLSGLVRWNWPAAGFFLARDFGARPRSEQEREQVLEYVRGLPEAQRAENINLFRQVFLGVMPLEAYLESVPLADKTLPEAGRAPLIATALVDVMDAALLDALESGALSDALLQRFYIKGKGFEAFLAFNGLTRTLVKRLQSMDRESAIAAVNRLDGEGNDLLVAAIKSLNAQAVAAILAITADGVNRAVSSDNPWHYSKGQRPLHMAIQWNVPLRIFELLISHGADPELKNGSGTSARWLLEYYKDEWINEQDKLNQVRALLKGERQQ